VGYVLGTIVTVLLVAAVCGALHLVRRIAPAGGLWSGGATYAVFGVLGTGVAVLLAFVILLGFQSFVAAKDSAGREAIAVTELARGSAFFGQPGRDEVRGELICYSRAVVEREWPAMARRQQSDVVEGWVIRLEQRAATAPVPGAREAEGLGQWLDESAARREGRRGRLAEAAPSVPPPLWAVLLLGVVVLVAYVVTFADPATRLWPQLLMVGSLTAVLVLSLLVVRFLDHPYGGASGSIRPTQMTLTLTQLEREAGSLDPPCDRTGLPTP
jgi:hypothetical protein